VGILPGTMVGRWVYYSPYNMVGILLPVHHGGYTPLGTPAYHRPSYRLHVTDPSVHGNGETAWAQGRRKAWVRGPFPS